MFSEGDIDMARRRGQRPTKKNPYQKKGSWYVRYREDVRLADGSIGRIERHKYLADATGEHRLNQTEAKRKAWDEVFSMLDQWALCPQSMATVRQFVEAKYTPGVVAKHRSKLSREVKQSNLKNHVLPAFGDRRLRDVGVEDVEALLDAKIASGLSTQTAKHIRNTISSIWRYARELKYFTGQLPTDFQWRVPMRRVRRRGSLSFEQAQLLAEALPEFRTLILFLVLTGCRIGEALGLRWRNVNLADQPIASGEVVIGPRSVALVEAWVRNEYTSVKCENLHERLVALPDQEPGDLFAVLLSHRTQATFVLPDQPVFASSTGRPVDQHNILKRKLKPAVAAINKRIEDEGLSVPKIPEALSWHWLRHTNASMTDQEGMSPVDRQKVLGHAAASMTMHYSHADSERQRAGLQRVANRLMAQPQNPKSPSSEKVIVFRRREAV
ncbi:MAG: tyrosine-type recombinase/integrase [Bryobacterales bacterium]